MKRSLGLTAVLVFVACGGTPPIQEVEQGLASATTIGRSISLALDAVSGTNTSCVQVVKACSTFPCDGEANVTLGNACPLATGTATGTVNVTGRWTSATKGELTAVFTDVKVGDESASAVASVKKVSVERSGNTITVEYSGSDAVAAAGSSVAAVGASNKWTLKIATQGTAEAADDVLTVDASSALGNAGAGTQAKTVKIEGVVFSPSCTKNPTAGTADITEVTNFIPRITEIEFGSACDGTAKVNGASTELNFFR